MPDSIRELLGLTQERLASWLGVNRTTLALVERKRRGEPARFGWRQDARLMLATLGRVLEADGSNSPGPPPLPVPAPDPAPFEARLDHCRHHARNLRYALEKMRRQAAPYLARLAALPALRAYTGPVENPAREANWLALLEEEAEQALLDICGPGPQRLLEARIAGLELEAQLLEEYAAALPGGSPAA